MQIESNWGYLTQILHTRHFGNVNCMDRYFFLHKVQKMFCGTENLNEAPVNVARVHWILYESLYIHNRRPFITSHFDYMLWLYVCYHCYIALCEQRVIKLGGKCPYLHRKHPQAETTLQQYSFQLWFVCAKRHSTSTKTCSNEFPNFLRLFYCTP